MIVLDTHAWIWLNNESDKLSLAAAKAIEATDIVGVAAISLWEVSMLSAYNRIELNRPLLPWLRKACDLPNVHVIPLTPEIAATSATLNMHGDPADRLITATALVHQCSLVTVDEKITKSGQVTTIW